MQHSWVEIVYSCTKKKIMYNYFFLYKNIFLSNVLGHFFPPHSCLNTVSLNYHHHNYIWRQILKKNKKIKQTNLFDLICLNYYNRIVNDKLKMLSWSTGFLWTVLYMQLFVLVKINSIQYIRVFQSQWQ